MSDDRPPAGFLIGAQVRLAAKEGIPMVVRRRGDENRGTIVIKVNRLDGTAHVLIQARLDEETVWTPVSRQDPMSDEDAERYLTRHSQIDLDSWVIEVEDKQGRHWFPGRIAKF